MEYLETNWSASATQHRPFGMDFLLKRSLKTELYSRVFDRNWFVTSRT